MIPIVNPGLLGETASNDVASNICQAIPGWCHSAGCGTGPARVAPENIHGIGPRQECGSTSLHDVELNCQDPRVYNVVNDMASIRRPLLNGNDLNTREPRVRNVVDGVASIRHPD
jgi:hypothetical protein